MDFVLKRMTADDRPPLYVGANPSIPATYPYLSPLHQPGSLLAEAPEEYDLVYLGCSAEAYAETLTTYDCHVPKFWVNNARFDDGLESCGVQLFNHALEACAPLAATLTPASAFSSFTDGSLREVDCGPLPASLCQEFSDNIWLRIGGWRNNSSGGYFSCTHGETGSVVVPLIAVANVSVSYGGYGTINFGPGWATDGTVTVCGQAARFQLTRPFAGPFMHGHGGCVLILEVQGDSPQLLVASPQGVNAFYDTCPLWQAYSHGRTLIGAFAFETKFYAIDGDPSAVRLSALDGIEVPEALTATIYAIGQPTRQVPMLFRWGHAGQLAYGDFAGGAAVIRHPNLNNACEITVQSQGPVMDSWYGENDDSGTGWAYRATLRSVYDPCTRQTRLQVGLRSSTAMGFLCRNFARYLNPADILSASPLHIDALVPNNCGEQTRIVIVE